MSAVFRVNGDGRGPGVGYFSDAVVIALDGAYLIQMSGMAAVDPVTKAVVGYEAHNGCFASDALERQVADIFRQLDRILGRTGADLGCGAIGLDALTRSLVFLREDYPKVFQRFNDAYVDEFKKRGVGEYPSRTTVLKATLPEPNALVEIQFDVFVAKESL
jgi:enamine deaminase RidA (YjgF/YER057c/UK114 family)